MPVGRQGLRFIIVQRCILRAMKNYLALFLAFLIAFNSGATITDSTTVYPLPDSIKAVQFMAETKVSFDSDKREVQAGIQTDAVKLFLRSVKNEKAIVFHFPANAEVMVKGIKVTSRGENELIFSYPWSSDQAYKLMVAVATDSAENFSLYSGYAWLPSENKWKLIGTAKISGRYSTILQPSTYFNEEKKQTVSAAFSQVWLQRTNGSWKNLKEGNADVPVINLFGHVDSVEQRLAEIKIIEAAIQAGTTDTKDNLKSVYYKIMKEGTGPAVAVTDTVNVFYKVTLLNDTAVIDEAKDKPARFPLNRLIKGWQIGVPLIKAGGKIKLVIPSDLAYSIRTRSPKIPPNSILEFEIEVVDNPKPKLTK